MILDRAIQIGLGAALVLALVAVGTQTVRLGREQRARSQLATEFAEAKALAVTAALEASQRYRALEARWATDLKGISDDAAKQTEAARLAADAAADAGRRLRGQLAALAASCRRPAADSAAAAGGASAPAAADLLADVQRRLDEAADRTARFADDSRIAGLTCERSYDSLTAPR